MYYLWDYRMVPFWARSAFGLARNMRKTYIQGVPKLTGLIFICCFAPRAVVLSWMNQQVWRIPFKTRIQSAPCWSWPGRDPIGQNWPAHHRSLLQLSTPRLASRSRLAFRSRWRPTGGRCGHCVGVRVRRASRHITALSFRVPLTSPCTLRQTLGFSCCLTASFGLLLSLSGFILIPQGAPRRQRFTVEREMLEPCRVKCWDKLRVAWCRFRNAVAVTLVWLPDKWWVCVGLPDLLLSPCPSFSRFNQTNIWERLTCRCWQTLSGLIPPWAIQTASEFKSDNNWPLFGQKNCQNRDI